MRLTVGVAAVSKRGSDHGSDHNKDDNRRFAGNRKVAIARQKNDDPSLGTRLAQNLLLVSA